MKRKAASDDVATGKQSHTTTGFLAGVKVFFVRKSIPHADKRIAVWTTALEKQGGKIAKSAKRRRISHFVLGELPVGDDLQLGQAKAVSTGWLEACLARGARQAEAGHLWISRKDSSPEGGGAGHEAEEHGRHYHLHRWLGHWKPEYDSFHTALQVVLQAKFGPGLPENQHIVKVMSQLGKYEGALAADYNSSGQAALGGEAFNRRAMLFDRVAAIVKACSFVITADLSPHDIPYGGEGMVARIHSIVERGSTDDLDAHRSGGMLYDGKGVPRGPDACGGAARHAMSRLQGVGSKNAAAWYNLGLRTVEDVVREAQPGGLLSPDSERKLNVIEAFSVRHHADLLADVPPEDVTEIRELVMKLLTKQTGPGWVMQSTGGERRGKAAHDADFLLFHPTRKDIKGVTRALADELIRRGRLVPPGQGYCAIQVGKDEANQSKPKKESTSKKGNGLPGDSPSLAEDRHDRILGIYITRSGHMRRTDLVMCPWRERAFALLGWTGSRQYVRFLREHAGNCGMKLSSHCLKITDSGKLVPYESPPLNVHKEPWWPPGWDPGTLAHPRAVQTESDIFELLGLPYREPYERQA
ncbi:hypothetical protein WJX73_004619 [Symbiochloris irregularis]|uniref:BRCT domain-containing protein n=1 Tax=Symbiochloris irregularis TaxID=706552 RepID=A0AAW1NTC1_9CHLO